MNSSSPSGQHSPWWRFQPEQSLLYQNVCLNCAIKALIGQLDLSFLDLDKCGLMRLIVPASVTFTSSESRCQIMLNLKIIFNH